MPIKHQLTLPKAKDILLGLYSFYKLQKAIGNRATSDPMEEGMKALSLYVKILDYFNYYFEDYDLEIEEREIMEVYEKFKQVYFSIKPINYVE